MKYSVDELFGKLERADAAGDSEAAKVIADEIRRVQAAPVNTAYQPTRRSPDDLREIAAKNAAANPVTKDMNNVQLFAAGAGKSIYDTGRGLAQVGDSVADFFAPRANTLSSLVTGQDNSRAAAGRMETDRQRQLDAALMDTGYGLAGNISGTIGQFVLPGGALKAATYANKIARAAPALNAASKVFLPNSLGGAATQGAVIGASQQLGVDDSRLRNTLLGTGAAYAGAAAPRVLGSLYRATGSYTGKVTASGVDRRIGDILRAEADNPNALLTVNPSRIAGAQRTLAEETLDAGLARLERNARSTGKGWDSLDRTNNAARVGAIEKFAGNENTLEAAKLARDKASNPLRKEAMQLDGVDTARLLSQIKRLETSQVGRPVVQSGLAQVRSLLTRQVSEAERKKTALAAMDGFVSTGRKSAADFAAGKSAMQAIRRGELPEGEFASQAGKDALKAAQKAFETEFRGHDKVAVLDNVRKTIGDMLSGKYGGDTPGALAGSRELMVVKNQLDRVLARQAPEYGQYLDAFRDGSKAMNRMEVGQSLISSRSGKADLDAVTGKQVLTPAAFSGRARDLDKVSAEATGFRKAKADNILRPEDFAAVRNVQDDLERRAFAATAGSGGNSQTFERMATNDRVAGGLMTKAPLGIGKLFEYLNDLGESRLQAKLSQVLANPAQARAILLRLPVNDRRTIESVLSRAGGLGGAALPAIIE